MNKIYEALEKKSQGKNKIRQFPEDPHGWLAARGDVSELYSVCVSQDRCWPLNSLVRSLVVWAIMAVARLLPVRKCCDAVKPVMSPMEYHHCDIVRSGRHVPRGGSWYLTLS
jgi:hypothetical protein